MEFISWMILMKTSTPKFPTLLLFNDAESLSSEVIYTTHKQHALEHIQI